MATTDITYNSTFTDSTRQVNGRIEIRNSPTSADLKSVAEGGTITGLQYLDKLLIVEKDIHIMAGGSFENCRNLDILMRDGARFTNATATTSEDDPINDGQIKLNNVRLLWSRHDTNNNIWFKWPFRSYSTVAYSNWGKVDGGSFTSINDIATANGIRLGFSQLANYRIASNSYAPNIDQVIFRNTQTATNLELDKVNRIVVENSANCILENITHSSPDSKALLITRYASLILNNWNTNDTNTEIRQFTHQTGDTERDHYIYLLGTASSHFPANHSDIIINQGTDAQRQRAHWLAGGMRYYQIYKDGSIHTAFRTGIFRNTDEQKSRPTLATSEMLETQTANYNHNNGKIKLATISKSITHDGTAWQTETITNNVMKIRSPDIIFQSIPLDQTQSQESLGNESSYVPFAVTNDPNYDGTDIGVIGISIADRQLIVGDNSINLQNLYDKIKRQFTNDMGQEIQIGRNGTWLTVDWSMTLPSNQSITPTARFKGIWLTGNSSRFTNLNVAKQIAIDHGIALRSTMDGVGILITSNATNTRFAISKTGEKNNPTYHTTPAFLFLDQSAEYLVTAKAEKYQYQQFQIDTANTNGQLEIRLPLEPNVKDITITQSEEDKFDLTNPEPNKLSIDVNAQLDLRAQRDKSMRIFDHLLTRDEGLKFLHNYTGVAVRFLFDRIMVQTDNISWTKSTPVETRARFGIPFFDIATEQFYEATPTAQNGYVVFDSIQILGIVEDELIQELNEKITTLQDQLTTLEQEVADDIDSLGFIELRPPNNLLDFVGAFEENNYLYFVKRLPESSRAIALKFGKLDGKFYGDRSFAFSTENIRAVKRIGNNYFILANDNRLIRQGITSSLHYSFQNYNFKSFAYVHNKFIFVGRNNTNGLTISHHRGDEFATYNSADFITITDNGIVVNDSDVVDCEQVGNELFIIRNGTTLYRFKLTFTDNTLSNIEQTGEKTLPNGKNNSPLIRFQNYIWYRTSQSIEAITVDRFVPITPDTLEVLDEVQYHKSAEIELLEKIEDIDEIVKEDETQLDTIHTQLTTAENSIGQNSVVLANLNSRLTLARANRLDHIIDYTTKIDSIKSATDKMSFENVAIVGEADDFRLKTSTWYDVIAGTTSTAGTYLGQFNANINTALTRLSETRANNLDNLDRLISSRASKTKQDTNETKLNNIQTKTDKFRFDNTNHVESSVQDVRGTAVTGIADFRTDITTLDTKISNVKSQTDKIRFVGTADGAGTQKISAESTVTGNVESSGLTETQANQLSHVYNQTLIDPDDDTTTLREQVNAVKTRVDQIPANITDAKNSIVTEIDANETKIDSVKTVVDSLPTSIPATDLTGIARTTDITTATTNIQTDIQTNENKLDAIKGVVDNLPTSTADLSGITATLTSLNTILNEIQDELDIDLTDNDLTVKEQLLRIQVALRNTTQTINGADETTIRGMVENIPSLVWYFTGDGTNRPNTPEKRLKDIEAETDKIQNIKTKTDTIPTDINDFARRGDIPTSNIAAIKAKTDDLQFNDNNDVKATLDGEQVTTDNESRQASKATGFATSNDIPTSDITAIKSKTDKLTFDNTNHVESSIQDVKGVAVNNIADFKANLLPVTEKIDNIKTKTDKLTFNDANDVISTLDGETVTTGNVTDAALQQIREEIEDEDNKIHDIQGKVTSIKTTIDTNLDQPISSRSTPENIISAQDMINTNIDNNEVKIDAIKSRTDKLYFESETKQSPQEKVQTYTTVNLGDTPVTIDLSTVESGIEDILEQLTEHLDEDDNTTLLGLLSNIKDFQQGTIEIDNTRIVYKDSDNNVVKSFLRRNTTTKADYSGGRIIEPDSS